MRLIVELHTAGTVIHKQIIRFALAIREVEFVAAVVEHAHARDFFHAAVQKHERVALTVRNKRTDAVRLRLKNRYAVCVWGAEERAVLVKDQRLRIVQRMRRVDMNPRRYTDGRIGIGIIQFILQEEAEMQTHGFPRTQRQLCRSAREIQDFILVFTFRVLELALE